MANPLKYADLKNAVSGAAAAFRCRRRLQPAGGEGDKVFPPTFAGAMYAVEQRRIPGQEGSVTCVLLDSVQSQEPRPEVEVIGPPELRERVARALRAAAEQYR